MNNLTNEQIARVFLMYWQNEFVYNGSLHVIRKVMGITRGFDIVDDGRPNDSFRVDKCKLLLNPLSAISDEDAIEVAKMEVNKFNCFYPKGFIIRRQGYETERPGIFFDYTSDGFTSCPIRLYTKYFRIYIDGSEHPLSYKSSGYLIQQGYAVPLFHAPNHPDNSKTAIQLGIAIDKTKEAI